MNFLYSSEIILLISDALSTFLPLMLSIISPVFIPQSLEGDFIPSAVKTSQIPITSTVLVFKVNPAGKPPRYKYSVSAFAETGENDNVHTISAKTINRHFINFFLKSITVFCATVFRIYKKSGACRFNFYNGQ